MKFLDNSYYKGILAEVWAALILTLKGYRIIKKRYRTVVGEIDIVAFKKKTLIFVEVKYRKSIEEAAYSITWFQQKRLRKAALCLTALFPHIHNYRFDAFLVKGLYFCHIKNIV